MALQKALQVVADRGKVRGAPHLFRANAGQALDKIGDFLAGIDKGIEPVHNPVALKLDRPNLDNFVPPVGVQTGRFQIQGHKSPLQGGPGRELRAEGHSNRPFSVNPL